MNSARGGTLPLVILSEAKDLLLLILSEAKDLLLIAHLERSEGPALIVHPERSEAQANPVAIASIRVPRTLLSRTV